VTDLSVGGEEVISQSRGKALVGVLVAGAFLGLCLWLDFSSEPHTAKGFLARYVGTPLYAVVLLVWIKTLLLPATLVLSPQGLRLRSLPGFAVAWGEIAGMAVTNPWAVEYVQLRLANGKKRNLPAAWARKPQEMLAAVQAARDRWGPPIP
jgi:hypothetical protein